ncbi:sodium:proton antiporter [Hujiaoplasma nucleasis]|uniref:Sodium:proton antiporter n=1 Tax=Hujiaoplasma nucleasis TaxID=2725268 RepID=A0A7L6MZC1_9MOLU|nr:cation:proton antiporter [Hujiaoplasma nucleasis]QLY39336.1 sodium:proton antiporter [Hujiaoplasma nucleasis]
MFLSISLIILISITLFYIFDKLHLPGLLAFLITGIILGPFVFDLISHQILDISSELRKIALVVILIRAGLSLVIKDLKAVGRPAILLSFLPALFEILAIGLLAPLFFNLTNIEAFILGSVIAAVSPAVIVPRMIQLIEKKKGTKEKIPQLILASASVDDIFVIIVFTIFLQVYESNQLEWSQILLLPISLIFGIILGFVIGVFFVFVFKKLHVRDTIKVLILFALSFLMIVLEDYLPISGLLGIITLAITIFSLYPILAHRLTSKFSKIWVVAEMMLFVLIGAAVDINLFLSIGLITLLFLLLSLFVRLLGVFISIIKTNFNSKEKLFIGLSFIPKATVQAAIGAIPLSMGIPGGKIILAISVLSIFLTAPLGAVLIDQTSNILLKNKDDSL